MFTLKDLSQQAWLATTDTFAFPDGSQGIAEVSFKVGFLAALQIVGKAQRLQSDALQGVIDEALEILDQTNPS